jgi:hypothetical protein
MNNKLTDDEIKELLLKRKEFEIEIKILSKKLRELEKGNKNLNHKIYEGCNHNWIKDIKYYTYDDRHNICTKCNFLR